MIDKPAGLLIPTHSNKLETTDIKRILITLEFKHILTDASLGYFRAPSEDAADEANLFSNVMDYFSIEKGWFNPYLFASSRRPLIPRTVVPDVVFCHGPWLKGDYSIGMTLLKESATVIALVKDPDPQPEEEDPSLIEKAMEILDFKKAPAAEAGLTSEAAAEYKAPSRPSSPSPFGKVAHLFRHRKENSKEATPPAAPTTEETATVPPDSPAHVAPSHPPPGCVPGSETSVVDPPVEDASTTPGPDHKPANGATTMIDRLTEQMNQWRSKGAPPGTDSASTEGTIPPSPPNRRMVVLVLALSPHRIGAWTSSQRPGESVMNYTLLNGCPALVVPIKPGCPLIAWHAVTLKTLQHLKGGVDGQAFKDILDTLVNYIDLCVDDERIELPPNYAEQSGLTGSEDEMKKTAVRTAMELVLAGAVRSGESAKVRKEVDNERAGIVFFRIP